MPSKAQIEFINEYARTLLVQWAVNTVQEIEPAIPYRKGWNPAHANDPEKLAVCRDRRVSQLEDTFIAHALKKGWVSKDGNRVLAKGFTVAKGFLKR